MRKVGLWPNSSKLESQNLTPQLSQWFRTRNWEVLDNWPEKKNQEISFLVRLAGGPC